MEVTFLIGNGFDVGTGIASRFIDFFPIYQAESLIKPDEIRMLSEEIGSDYKTWADFESALGDYTEKFSEETKDRFINQVKDFEISFIEYIKNQEKLLNFKNTSLIRGTFEKALTGFFKNDVLNTVSSNIIVRLFNNHRNEDYICNFISFNYTGIVSKCLEVVKANKTKDLKYNIGSLVNVHGKCDFYPIMGVNDAKQIKNKELANDSYFTSIIVKPKINKLIGNNNEINARDLINRSTIIVIYGMSLGKTDALWWDAIIQWLNANAERQLVLFDYDPGFQTTMPFDWIDKNERIKNKILSYSSRKDINKGLLRDRIHIAVHKNLFEMDLMKEHREFVEKAFEEMMEERMLNS
jgi:hypothetical protein